MPEIEDPAFGQLDRAPLRLDPLDRRTAVEPVEHVCTPECERVHEYPWMCCPVLLEEFAERAKHQEPAGDAIGGQQ
jgi:hypothetical protein